MVKKENKYRRTPLFRRRRRQKNIFSLTAVALIFSFMSIMFNPTYSNYMENKKFKFRAVTTNFEFHHSLNANTTTNYSRNSDEARLQFTVANYSTTAITTRDIHYTVAPIDDPYFRSECTEPENGMLKGGVQSEDIHNVVFKRKTVDTVIPSVPDYTVTIFMRATSPYVSELEVKVKLLIDKPVNIWGENKLDEFGNDISYLCVEAASTLNDPTFGGSFEPKPAKVDIMWQDNINIDSTNYLVERFKNEPFNANSVVSGGLERKFTIYVDTGSKIYIAFYKKAKTNCNITAKASLVLKNAPDYTEILQYP